MIARFYGGSLDGQTREVNGLARTIWHCPDPSSNVRESYVRDRSLNRRDEDGKLVELGCVFERAETFDLKPRETAHCETCTCGEES